MIPGDEQLVRRAARQTGLRVAALVAAAMLLLVGLATFVVVRQQSAATDTLLRNTVASADDVVDPPPGGWLLMTRSGRVLTSPGLPSAQLPGLALLRADASDRVRLADVGEQFRAATVARDGGVVQLLLDLRGEQAQRSRLLKVMALAGALALLLAAGLGAVLGRRAVRPLADALALQRSFIADASHELRTPLTLLSTRAQLLDGQLQHADPQLRQDSAGVVHDVQRLGEVLEDLLLSADPRRPGPNEPVELAEVVDGAVTSARPHALQRGISLDLDVTDQPLLVLGWEPALRRAILSLVDNAIDHTPEGGTVTVAGRRDRRHVVVEVSDTGPGLDPAAAREVFRRFHSGGHRAGRAHYGLGLALSHDVANQHGGRLELVAREVGATFRLTLPAYKGPAQNERRRGSKTQPRNSGETGGT